MTVSAPIRIGVDIGGTFTDVALERGSVRVTAKIPTTAAAPERGILDALDGALAEAGAAPGDTAIVIHGTTLATNALIERTGARTALITPRAFATSSRWAPRAGSIRSTSTSRSPSPLCRGAFASRCPSA